jgi:hypothetical protein
MADANLIYKDAAQLIPTWICPSRPRAGDLDIRQVNESPYFFA